MDDSYVDGDWNLLDVNPIPQESAESSNASSCELVKLENEEDAVSFERTVTISGAQSPARSSCLLEQRAYDQDTELRHLIEILQQQRPSRSGSRSSSRSSASDFVHLNEVGEPIQRNSSSNPVSHRFHIVTRRDDFDQPDHDLPGQLPEDDLDLQQAVDDRVESDILATSRVTELSQNDQSEDDSLAIQRCRSYTHRPNSTINDVLTIAMFCAFGFLFGIGVGHFSGSSREAYLQQQVQEGQKLRLRAVQDDLLMCLRKQEDIDATLSKLNEIEAFLVDAEHWRGEYEELLHQKLMSEESFRKEKSQLQARIAELDQAQVELIRQKSCAHDSEFLTRQEITLNSVHQKLEDNLREKDGQLSELQREVSSCRVELGVLETSCAGYRKASEDTAALNAQLKEQLSVHEKELFKVKAQTELGAKHSSDQSLNMETSVFSNNFPSLETCFKLPEMGSLASQVEAQRIELQNLREMVSRQTQIMTNKTLESAAVSSQLPSSESSTDKPLKDITSSADGVVYTQQSGVYDAPSDATSSIPRGPDVPPARNGKAMTNMNKFSPLCNCTSKPSRPSPFSNSTCITINVCDKFKVNLTSHQLHYMFDAMKTKYSNIEESVLNMWDQFIGNLSSPFDNWSQSVTNSTHTHNYMHRNESPGSRTPGQRPRDAFQKILDKVNSTWQDLRMLPELLDAQHNPSLSRLHKKINKFASKINNSIGHMAHHLFRMFGNRDDGDSLNDSELHERKRKGDANSSGSKNRHPRPSSHSNNAGNGFRTTRRAHSHTASHDHRTVSHDHSTVHGHTIVQNQRASQSTTASHDRRESRDHVESLEQAATSLHRLLASKLSNLRRELAALDAWQVSHMEQFERDLIHKQFDDILVDYGILLSDDEQKWILCQLLWWKHHMTPTGEENAIDDHCSVHLWPWQTAHRAVSGNGKDAVGANSWMFERANFREFLRNEPDDWYWRRSRHHDRPSLHPADAPFPKDEL